MKKRKNKQQDNARPNLTPEQKEGHILVLKDALENFRNGTNIQEAKTNTLRMIGDIYGENSSQYTNLSGVNAMLYGSDSSSNVQSFISQILQTIFELDPTGTI